MSPLLPLVLCPTAAFVPPGDCGDVVREIGEVGGRANGTELMECAPRLCTWLAESEAERAAGADGSCVRTLVIVIVTEKVSPAK